MNNLVFTPIPIEEIQKLITCAVEKALQGTTENLTKSSDNDDRLMSPEELKVYLPDHPARQTIYGWVNNRKIPFEKHGRKLLFRRSSIEEWLNNGRQVSHLKED